MIPYLRISATCDPVDQVDQWQKSYMRLVPTESLGTEMRLDIGGLIPGPSRDLSVTLLAKVTHMCSLCENAPMVLVCVICNVYCIQSQSSSKVMGHKVCLLVLDLSVLDQFLYTLYKIQLGSARWIVRRDQFVKVMRGNTRDVLVAM